MLDIRKREKVSSITKKKSLSLVGEESSGRQNFDDRDDCIDTCINDDVRNDESVYKDVITNIRQSFDTSLNYHNTKSELDGYRAHQHGRSLRRKIAYISEDSSTFQKNKYTRRDIEAKVNQVHPLHKLRKKRKIVDKESFAMNSKADTVTVDMESIGHSQRLVDLYELGKHRVISSRESAAAMIANVDTLTVDMESIGHSQRIIDLYELGKHRVISNRESAAANSLVIDNLAANVAALSNTTSSASEIAGRRLFNQAKLSAEIKDKVRQIASEAPLPQMELATHRRGHTVSIHWKNYREMKKHRIATLYELGKKKVIAKRELATSKAKTEAVVINIESIILSQRIVALYELGKKRVIVDRQLAAAKLVPIDNLTVNVNSISDTIASPSEIAGQRLFIQAKQSTERLAKLRQKAKETPLPQLELETKKRSDMMSVKWGTSAIERFLMLYEKGRSQVAAERNIKIKVLNERVNLSEKVDTGYASTRQLELYMMGTQRLIHERLGEKQNNDSNNLSSKLQTKIEANATMLKLYELSKKQQESGKQRQIMRDEERMNLSMHQTSCSSSEIVPNATMVKLYAMSEIMQDHGKQRREKIASERLKLTFFKV